MKLYDANESLQINQIYNQIIFLFREQREIIHKLTDKSIIFTQLREQIQQKLVYIANQFSYLDESKYKKAVSKFKIELEKQDRYIHIRYNQEFLIFIMRKLDKYQQCPYVRELYTKRMEKLLKTQNIQLEYQLDEISNAFIEFLSKLNDNLLENEIDQLSYLIDVKDLQVTADQFAVIVDTIKMKREEVFFRVEKEILTKIFEEDKIKLFDKQQRFQLMDPNIQKFVIESKEVKKMIKYQIDKKVNDKIQYKRVVLKFNNYERTVINMSNKPEKGFFIAINYSIKDKKEAKQQFELSRSKTYKEILIHPKIIKDLQIQVIYQLAKEMYRNQNTFLYSIRNFYELMEGYHQRRQEKLLLKQDKQIASEFDEQNFKHLSMYQDSLQEDSLYFNKDSLKEEGIYLDSHQNAVIIIQKGKTLYLGNQCDDPKQNFIRKNIPKMSKNLFRFFIYVILTRTEDQKLLYQFLDGDHSTIQQIIQIAQQDR